ncbi:MAG TPA: hypothetical protein PKY59_03180 [Pyrinomonadaceae bacterium]|nr:hypothetical protein [Pyrinomonadaceae bacterium]
MKLFRYDNKLIRRKSEILNDFMKQGKPSLTQGDLSLMQGNVCLMQGDR